MNELAPDRVLPALKTTWLGRNYHYFPQIESTNTMLKRWLAAESGTAVPTGTDVPAGTLLLADFQSQGRGRLSRTWEAPPATCLLFSLLFRPDWPAAQAHWITMTASVAAAEAMTAVSGLLVGVKWPNDLVIQQEGVWRKVGGILQEGRVGEDGRIQTVILGMGLNINIPPAQLPQTAVPAASLLSLTGKTSSRRAILVDLLHRLETAYALADRGQSPQKTWAAHLVTVGQAVQIAEMNGERVWSGTAVATDEWGHLLVQDERGKMHTIAAGDVSLRPEVA